MQLRLLGWPVRLSAVLLVLGLALRGYHFGRNPSVWHDEAALILNVIGKSFAGLLGPLYFAEAGPPLFLWLERLVRLWLGDGVFALRLLPFLASCAALLLVVRSARRFLLPAAVPVAVLFFACSRSLLWHASEAKPYALDVAIAAALPCLVCGGLLKRWSLPTRLFLLASLAPLVVLLSYPGCFMMGGVVLSMAPEVSRSRRPRDWLALAALVGAVCVSFLWLLTGPIRAQRCPDMESCWTHAFAPWNTPWRVPLWMLSSWLGAMRYCVDPLGDWLILPACLGLVSLWRRGWQSLVILLVSPITLAFLAACLRAYPFDASRVVAFAAPALVLAAAEGIAVLAASLAILVANGSSPARVWAGRFGLAALAISLAVPALRAVHDVVKPWPRADVAGAADFVLGERQAGEPVAGNHWEHAYYFRRLHEEFVFWDGRPLPDAPRLWLVITAGSDAENDLLTAVARGAAWRIVQDQRFEQCHAMLLERWPAGATPLAPLVAGQSATPRSLP
jgi:hypothetical protein